MTEPASGIIFEGSTCPPGISTMQSRPHPHNFIELDEKKIKFCNKCGLCYFKDNSTWKLLFKGSKCEGTAHDLDGAKTYNKHDFDFLEGGVALCKNCGLAIKH